LLFKQGFAVDLIRPARSLLWPDLVYTIQEILSGTPEVYLVGGMVRDAYRDFPFKDIDLACKRDGCRIARQLADALGGAYYPLDKERDMGRTIVRVEGEEYVIDVTPIQGEDLLADLRGRDFTVNAMAVPLASDLSGIYDPLGGIKDWLDKTLRRCTPDSIYNDPIRALRAVRLSLSLGLTIEPETRHDIRKYGSLLLEETSPERIRDELFRMIGGKRPQAALAALEALGLLKLVIPEVAGFSPEQWRYTLQTIDKLNTLMMVISEQRDDNIAANVEFGTFVYLLDRYRRLLRQHIQKEYPEKRQHQMLLIFAVLLRYAEPADPASAQVASERAKELKLSNQEVERIHDALLYAAIPMQLHEHAPLDAREIYRFWRKTREAGVDACLLGAVDYLTSQGTQLDSSAWTSRLQTVGQLLNGYQNAMTATPIINGDDLMEAFNLSPSPLIRELLEALREAAALGEITTRDDAFRLAADLLQAKS
jgi:poly(A) polymerase/tRNA nucleotidyltransferase (CCA-adding enzyme)